MHSFIWKNRDSYEDFRIVINKRPPLIKPEKNVEELEVPGRDGDLTIDYASYKPITFPFTCTLLDPSRIDEMISWLDGYGDLVLSWQNDRKYKAKMISKIDIKQSFADLNEFAVLFKAQPFGYSISNNPISLVTTPSIVTNSATLPSKPLIKIYGNGSIELTVNEKVITLSSVSEYVTVDSEMVDCYKGTELMNHHMFGEFPELLIGQNTISWAGEVSKVEITPNWRWF